MAWNGLELSFFADRKLFKYSHKILKWVQVFSDQISILNSSSKSFYNLLGIVHLVRTQNFPKN